MAPEDMMNLLCTVTRHTPAVADSVGGIVQAETVGPVGVPCCVQQMTAAEREAHGRVGVVASHVIWLPAEFRSLIDHTCRIKVFEFGQDRFYEVADVEDPQHREMFTRVAAQEYQGETGVAR